MDTVVDFESPVAWADLVRDVLFSALETTLRVAGSQEAQRGVDHGYQLRRRQLGGTGRDLLARLERAAPPPARGSSIRG